MRKKNNISIVVNFQSFVKMEDIFSSNSGNIIQKHIDTSQNETPLTTDENLEQYFDIDKIVSWIKIKNFKRVRFVFSSFVKFNFCLIFLFCLTDCFTISGSTFKLFD